MTKKEIKDAITNIDLKLKELSKSLNQTAGKDNRKIIIECDKFLDERIILTKLK